MNVIVAHNCYKEPGGEDQCVEAEIALLRSRGHDVHRYHVANSSIDSMNQIQLASRTIWSWPTFHDLRALCRKLRPQVVHFHNTLPLISPAGYYAAKAEGVGVVQTLHNFRLCCVNGLLFREGNICEQCLGRTIPWKGIMYKCYRNSRPASAAVAAMVAVHRILGTWRNAVDVYVTVSESSRRKLIEGGLPSEKTTVKFNFLYPDPGPGTGEGNYGIYVGRLSPEKGLGTLLTAWRQLDGTADLKIIGDGPLGPSVAQAVTQNRIQWHRAVSRETVYDLVGNAAFLILPSECYETFGRVVIEAFAKGTPVLVSKLGAMAEFVDDGFNGFHFKPGDPNDLTDKINTLLSSAARLRQMRLSARETFVSRFSIDANYDSLMQIYRRAISVRGQRDESSHRVLRTGH